MLEIPMLGEDLGSGLNQRVRRGNQALRKVAAAHGVPCLPLYDRLAALLPPDHRPPAYAFSALSAVKAALAHRIRHRSWSEIARRNGLAVLTDHLHLSEPGAEAVADLIGGFLEAQSA